MLNKIRKIFYETGFASVFIRSFKYFWFIAFRFIDDFTLKLSISVFSSRHKFVLRQFLAESEVRYAICIFGSKNWNYPMVQRCHQLAKAFSKRGFTVFFFYPEPHRKFINGLKRTNCGVSLIFNYNLINYLPYNCILLFPSTALHLYYKTIKNLLSADRKIIYDYIDSMHEDTLQIEISQEISGIHKNLLTDERIKVAASSNMLFEDTLKYRKSGLEEIPNACDFEHFHQKHNHSIPKEIQEFKAGGKIILGFYGTIFKWLDFDLLKYIAASNKKFLVVLIGTLGDFSASASGIKNIANIKIIKAVNYERLPLYLHGFDVALIPFKNYGPTAAASPIKLFEYLAAGIPVVSIDIPECRRYQSVFCAATYDDFLIKINLALEIGKNAKFIDKMNSEARMNTWGIRVKQIINLANQKTNIKLIF